MLIPLWRLWNFLYRRLVPHQQSALREGGQVTRSGDEVRAR
ncbi:MAG: hypothetical protein ACRDRI_10330 [Pseudonocardiaceae bacterium]